MLNLYDHHSNPEQLTGYNSELMFDTFPDIFFERLVSSREHNPDLAKYILKSAMYSYYYALYVFEDRWPEAEPTIMQNPHIAVKYAIYILKRRWPEAEPYIQQNPREYRSYLQHFESHNA